MTDYLNTFGVTVAERIKKLFVLLFDPSKDPLSPEVLVINQYVHDHAGYSLYDAQLAVAEAVKRQLQRSKVGLIVAECGSGKTKLGTVAIASAAAALCAQQKSDDQFKTFNVVLCPSHVTKKWVREAEETVPNTFAAVVHSIQEFDQLYRMYERGTMRRYPFLCLCPKRWRRNMLIHANRDELLRRTKQAALAVPKSTELPQLRGIHMEADARRSMLTLTAVNDVYEMGLAGKSIVFWNGTLLFSARLMEGKYPNTGALLENLQSKYSVNLVSEELSSAISSAAVVDTEGSRVELAFEEHEIRVGIKTAQGQASMPVKALVLSAPDRPFYYNYKILLKYLRLVSGNVSLDFDANGLLAIRKPRPTFSGITLCPTVGS